MRRLRRRRRRVVVTVERDGPWLVVSEGRRRVEVGRSGTRNAGEVAELVRWALVRYRWPDGT